MHDDLAEENKKWGLERGQDIKVTGAKHRTTEQYWKWLTDQCNKLENKKDALNREIRLLEILKVQAKNAVKDLETMVPNINTKIKDLHVESKRKGCNHLFRDSYTQFIDI